MYEIRDASFNVIDTAAELVDGPEVPEHRRADGMTKGKAIGDSGRTCIVIDVRTGAGVAGFGRRPGLLLRRWREGVMPGVVRGAA